MSGVAEMFDSCSASSDSESNSDESDRFFLSQSELYPASLCHAVKALEGLISDLRLHKSRIDCTYERYTKYGELSEERKLSLEILKAHIGYFQKSFVSFLEYIKYGMDTPSASIKSTEEPRISACQRILEYNIGGSKMELKSDVDQAVPLLWVDELVSLVRTVCEVSRNLARKYWDEEVRISLAGPGTPPAL